MPAILGGRFPLPATPKGRVEKSHDLKKNKKIGFVLFKSDFFIYLIVFIYLIYFTIRLSGVNTAT